MDQLPDMMEEGASEIEFNTLPPEIVLHIYSFLPLDDVLTMFDVNKRCRGILQTDLGFLKNDFSRVSLKDFGNNNELIFRRKRNINYVCIKGVRVILRFLRVYWDEIRVIHLSCAYCHERWQMIIYNYIEEYRRTQIKNLSMSFFTAQINLPIRSFDNLTSVRFRSCYFCDYLSYIPNLFPKIKNIEFLKLNCFERRALYRVIRISYAHLVYMRVSPYSFTENQFALMKCLNPNVFFGYHDKKIRLS